MARRRTKKSTIPKSTMDALNQASASTLQLSLLSVVLPLAVNGGAERLVTSLSGQLPYQLAIEALTGISLKLITKSSVMPPHSHTILWGTIAAMAITTAQYLNVGNTVSIPFTGGSSISPQGITL